VKGVLWINPSNSFGVFRRALVTHAITSGVLLVQKLMQYTGPWHAISFRAVSGTHYNPNE